MAEKVSIYFREEDVDLYEWMEKKIEDGRFRNRAHAVTEALRDKKDDCDGGVDF